MKGFLFALFSVLLVSLAQLFLRAAMPCFPGNDELLTLPLAYFRTPLLLLFTGLSAYALSMLSWLVALRYLPLRQLYPLLSLSYVLVWLAAVFLPVFNEAFHWSSLAGVMLIIFGLICVSMPQRK